jgi:hypothetical protein
MVTVVTATSERYDKASAMLALKNLFSVCPLALFARPLWAIAIFFLFSQAKEFLVRRLQW